jgi:SUKH superfamily protein
MRERAEALFQLVRDKAGEGSFGGGADDGAIADAERSLGVTLPAGYRWFVREFGFSYWPIDIYGIVPGGLPGMQVVSNALTERHGVEPPLPQPLVPFSPDGWGNHYCLDTSRLSAGECPVVFWNHQLGASQTPKVTNASFLDWLEEAVQTELGYEADVGEAPSG